MPRYTNGFHIVRTFRLAIAASGEYTQFHGGTVVGASSAIDELVTRFNEIYFRELGIQFRLVSNNHSVIFTNSLTDPFTLNNPSLTTIQEAQATFDQYIGTQNYDLGILLNTGTYGLAFLRSVCDPQRKGSSCMGLPEPVGEKFHIYVAHEIAHQFGALHTFNAETDFCIGSRDPSSAMEPGTGSTLMSYAGLNCGNSFIQPLMDDYFHARSIAEIEAFLGKFETCAQISISSNRPPEVFVEDGYTIPILTPFVLEACGSDPDGDELTYCWEQYDIGPPQTFDDPDNGLSPLFRSFPPTTNHARTFPRMEALLANTNSPGEKLPSTNRTFHFRVTVRDSQEMGANAWASLRLDVTNSAGPFRITSHNEKRFFRGGQTVTWDVAGTTNVPVNVAHVNILLSTNGGYTFSVPLAMNTPNDGSETVQFPFIDCSNARIKIEAVENIFFDINDSQIALSTRPVFSRAELMGENIVLRWTHITDKQYQIECATNLPPDWQTVEVVPEILEHEMKAVIPRTAKSAFFRLREF